MDEQLVFAIMKSIFALTVTNCKLQIHGLFFYFINFLRHSTLRKCGIPVSERLFRIWRVTPETSILFPYMSQNWILSELCFVHVLKYWSSYWILICVFYLKGCPRKCFMPLVCAVIKVIYNLKINWPAIKQNLCSGILHGFVLFRWLKWVRYLIH